jgi:raffinose/stachyose/melibiose transport system permease protein
MNTNLSLSHVFRSTLISRLLVIFYVFLLIYPVSFVVLTSLKSTSEFYSNIWGLPRVFAWSNYVQAWVQGGIGRAFLNSVLIVTISVIGILTFGMLGGYALARLEVPYASVIVLCLILMTLIPGESMLLPTYIMTIKLGLIGTRLGLILPYIGWGLPMTIYLFRGFFLTVPNELIESARIDGAGELRIFYGIVAPLLLPAIATSAILSFIGLWGELLWALIVLSNQASIRTLPFTLVEFTGQYATNWGPLSAAICIILLPVVVFFLFSQKFFITGLTAGGVKG